MSELLDENIKAVLFDHDDTLVHTKGPKIEQHRYVAQQFYTKEISDDEIAANWGRPLSELAGILYGTEDIETAMRYIKSCYKMFPKTAIKGAVDKLLELHDRSIKIGIISATLRFSLDHDLSDLGYPIEALDFIQTEEDTEFHKPDPRVFVPVLKWLGKQAISPQQVIYVGDGMRDLQAARGAGFNFIGVETGFTTVEQFKAVGAISVATVAEIAI